MPTIRPVSDLRNSFAEITREVQASKEPVFLTKNGVGSIVVMSMEAYEEGLYESRVYGKLLEAQEEAAGTSKRYSHDEVMEGAEVLLRALEEQDRV